MMHALNSKNFVAGCRMQLLCLGMVLFLSSAYGSPSFRDRQAVSPPKVMKLDRGKFSHWGPQSFLGWLPVRSRRTEMDNRISPLAAPPPPTFPQPVSPEASALGESVMEEFILFLTMKDAGLLDFCMQFK